MSKDRGIESGLANLVLGPSATSTEPHRSHRIVSESAAPQSIQAHAVSGYNTPDPMAYADGRGAASLLSRSRSDPIPPSPNATKTLVAPNRAPASRRASNAQDRAFAISPADSRIAPGRREHSAIAPPALASSPRRGRSRDRNALGVDVDMTLVGFNHPPDRENAPSRSRHRREGREERRRSDESRERERQRHFQPTLAADPAPIMPSWNRRTTSVGRRGEGVAPTNMRRTGSGGNAGQRSPRGDGDEDVERRRDDLRRASNQLGAVFGIAAG